MGGRAALPSRPWRGAKTSDGARTRLGEQGARGRRHRGRRWIVDAFDSLDVGRRTSESRARQGLPRHVEDPGTISRLRLLIGVALPTNKEGRRSRAA